MIYVFWLTPFEKKYNTPKILRTTFFFIYPHVIWIHFNICKTKPCLNNLYLLEKTCTFKKIVSIYSLFIKLLYYFIFIWIKNLSYIHELYNKRLCTYLSCIVNIKRIFFLLYLFYWIGKLIMLKWFNVEHIYIYTTL